MHIRSVKAMEILDSRSHSTGFPFMLRQALQEPELLQNFSGFSMEPRVTGSFRGKYEGRARCLFGMNAIEPQP